MSTEIRHPKCTSCDKMLDIRKFSDDRNLLLDVPVGYSVHIDESSNGHLEIRYWCETCARG